jgi:RimJ/RimL family protein N-acetyltransferase
METMQEQRLVGIDYLEAVTALLQRVRNTHPTKGLYQAAELQFWWRVPRITDSLGQVFWFDDDGLPEAAAVMVDFTDGSSAVYDEVTFCPFFMPDVPAEQVAHVVKRGLALAGEYGFPSVELEVDQSDDVMHEVLASHGFTMKEEDVLVEAWMPATSRPEISPLNDGYRLASRSETKQRPHHMSERNPAFVEERLLETSLYRPDLDLVMLDRDDNYAAYGLFWYDPETATGVVEPMRTNDEYQRQGFARHLLTAGVDMLAKAGAERISIGYEPENPASGHLYRSVGFEPATKTDLLSGPTIARAS